MAKDALLCGDVRRLTLRLSLPALFAMLFSGLSSLLDALFLSRPDAQIAAAVGLCFPLATVLQTIGFTAGIGAGSLVSRSIGSGTSAALERAQTAAATALYGAVGLALFFCLLGQCFPEALVRLLGGKKDVSPFAVSYARWVLLSGPVSCASLVLSSLLRGQGHTAPGVLAYGAGTLLGAALCALLVSRLSLGITGAGIAMLAREALILLLFINRSLRLPGALRPRPRDARLRLCILADIMRSGTPTLVRQGLSSVSGILLTRACAQLGAYAVAGMGLALRILSLISSCVIGFLQGFAPVCGAAYGAGQMERVREGYLFCRRLLLVSLLALGGALFFAAPALMRRFSPDAQTALFGAGVLRAQSAVLFAQGVVLLMNALTQSMGLPLRATLIASGRQGYVLIPLLFVMPRLFALQGIIYAQPVSDLLSLLIGWALMKGLTGFSSSRCGYCDAPKASR